MLTCSLKRFCGGQGVPGLLSVIRRCRDTSSASETLVHQTLRQLHWELRGQGVGEEGMSLPDQLIRWPGTSWGYWRLFFQKSREFSAEWESKGHELKSYFTDFFIGDLLKYSDPAAEGCDCIRIILTHKVLYGESAGTFLQTSTVQICAHWPLY